MTETLVFSTRDVIMLMMWLITVGGMWIRLERMVATLQAQVFALKEQIIDVKKTVINGHAK